MPGCWYRKPLSEREAVYRRQFQETAPLRRWIYGLLPLRRAGSVMEPGCGTGLVLSEVRKLTDALLTGLDRDEQALETARTRVPDMRAVCCDIEKAVFDKTDIVLLSHILLESRRPVSLLARLGRSLKPGGRLAVLGEYDWETAREEPRVGALDRLRSAMKRDGLVIGGAGALNHLLEEAGLSVEHSGAVESPFMPLDPVFFESQTGSPPEPGQTPSCGAGSAGPSMISVLVRWAVCVKNA